MHYLRLYGKFLSIYLKTLMEYRFGFIIDNLSMMIGFFISTLSVWIIMDHFQVIQGWGMYEVIFLFALNGFTYGVGSLLFWSPMYQVESMVQQGTFDSILIRPLHSLVHMVFRVFNHAFLVSICFNGALILLCLGKLDLVWSAGKGLWLLLVVFGGVLIHSAILILGGSLSFWTVKSHMALNICNYSLRSFVNYPISIYQKWIQAVLTFVIPYGFVNFYPMHYFLDSSGREALFHPIFQFGTPVMGLLMMGLAYWIWRTGVNKYQGAGS